MIPARIKQIAGAALLVGAVASLCFARVDLSAATICAVTTLWMLANLLVWAVVMKIVLLPGNEKPAVGTAAMGILGKFVLLIGGIVALRMFAPFTAMQVYAILAGVSSVLVTAFLKALGARLAALSARPAGNSKSEAAKA